MINMRTEDSNKKHFCNVTALGREGGSALIVSLLILIVLSLLGLTAVRTTTLEEKMAGNLRDNDLAFQSAESALRDAETFVDTVVSVNAFNDTGGLYSSGTPDPDYFAAATWSTANSAAFSGAITGVANQPRYIIKYMGVVPTPGGALNIGGYGKEQAGTLHSFRISARGTGGRGGTQVVLQEYYGRRM
jgi:type IV pilus assembly protein PilX